MKDYFSFRKSLHARFFWATVLMVLPLAVLVLMLYATFNSTIKNIDHVIKHSSHELIQLGNLKDNINRAIMAPNDYLIHGSNTEKSVYQYTKKKIERDFETLEKSMSVHEDELIPLMKAWDYWKQVDIKANFIFSTNNPIGNTDIAAEMETMDLLADKCLQSLQKTLITTQGEVKSEMEDIKHLNTDMMILILGGATISALIIIWLITVLAKSVINPICCIKHTATAIGDGDYRSRLLWQRSDEIGELSQSFDMMADKLESSHTNLETLSRTDGLTGIFNRREFDRFFKNELDRSLRYGRNTAIIIFDVDHFKLINDRYGHITGDNVLIQLAHLIEETIRDTDMLARYGGEEFVLTLPEIDNNGAYILSERIRTLVESKAFKTPNGTSIAITVSAGIACYPNNGQTTDKIIFAADQALYAAKDKGRNCVICAGPSKQQASM